MRSRLLGLALASAVLVPGCFFWRPCGCHRRCCASPISGAPGVGTPAAGWPQASRP